ncbi:unnamed protein product, partial [Brenthis ino]
MLLCIVLAVLCFSSGALADPDPQSFTDIIITVLKKHDPLFIEKIEGNLSKLKYTLYNSTAEGYKNCEIKNFKVNKDETAAQLELHCSSITLAGDYDIKGRLIVLNIEGHGGYNIISGKYKITIDFELTKAQGKDGITHLAIKNFKIKCEGLSANKYKLKNLFNGQKELSDAVHKFAHENWKEVGSFVEGPVWTAIIKKVIHYINDYLKGVPLENIVLY